jgi:hypothetical protein
MALTDAFAARLSDVLATLEVGALLGASERRVRGLGSLLHYACASMPCDEAFVAIELEHLGRMTVPGIATRDGWRPVGAELSPLGTPFAYLFAGGTGHAVELVEGDAMLSSLAGALVSSPKYGIFVPVHLGSDVVGGVALLRTEAGFGADALGLAERLADVAAGTLEAYRTEQVLLELFARVLPELCATDGETGFAGGLARFLHGLRLTPEYRRRLVLADAVARLAAQGPAEAELAADVVVRVERYVASLHGGALTTPIEPGAALP